MIHSIIDGHVLKITYKLSDMTEVSMARLLRPTSRLPVGTILSQPCTCQRNQSEGGVCLCTRKLFGCMGRCPFRCCKQRCAKELWSCESYMSLFSKVDLIGASRDYRLLLLFGPVAFRVIIVNIQFALFLIPI